MLMRTLLPLLVLGLPARGAIIQTHEPQDVAPHASHVILARLDRKTKTATVLRVYRGRIGTKLISIVNLDDTPQVGADGPVEAWLFLDRMDHRYFLVRRGAPLWLQPHSAIYYRSKKHACTWHQPVNPGDLQLGARWTEAEFETQLQTCLKAPLAKRSFRPNLSEKDAQRFYAAIEPAVDYHGRRIAVEPINASAYFEALRKFAKSAQGEPQRRAIEVHLILTGTKDPHGNLALKRVAVAEQSLRTLLPHVPDELAVATLLDALRSTHYSAGKAVAAMLLRGYPDALPEAKKILVAHIRNGGTLGSRAYWAMRRMGFRAEADAAHAK